MMPNLIEGEAVVYVQVFLYLQILDFLTTLVGLKLGIAEASPFIRSLLHFGPSVAVAASKIVAIALAGLCIGLNRSYLVRWINYWYAGVVVWNLCNILVV
jgi:hypothetical protein